MRTCLLYLVVQATAHISHNLSIHTTQTAHVWQEFLDRVLGRISPHAQILLLGQTDNYARLARTVAAGQNQTVHEISHAPNLFKSWNVLQKQSDWVLLLYFSPGKDLGRMLQRAQKFFSVVTVTYLVVRYDTSQTDSAHLDKFVRLLLSQRFKIQVLSSTRRVVPPNYHITEENYLSFVQINHDVVSYLFATQGLDLAIPSRAKYLDGNVAYTQAKAAFLPCPTQYGPLQLSVTWKEDSYRKGRIYGSSDPPSVIVDMTCSNNLAVSPLPVPPWRVDRSFTSTNGEAFCVKARCNRPNPYLDHIFPSEPLCKTR